MNPSSNRYPAVPLHLNLGSGKDFRDDCLNLDVDDTWAPDAVCDLSRIDPQRGVSLTTTRFGDITLIPGSFDTIIANDVLEHVPDLMAMMTTCLTLLRVGGQFRISVPYDLSYGAWQDPTHVRAFNERSWLYYTEWFWYMGWSEFRFDLETFDFVPSPLGLALKEKEIPREDILRTPRAIDSMTVHLRKVLLTDNDKVTWQHWRDRKRAARDRRTASVSTAVERPTIVPAAEDRSGPKAFDGDFNSQRDRYAIWIVTPPNYSHHHALDEVALGLHEAFAELGGSAPIIRDLDDRSGRIPIILGAHLLSAEAAKTLPDESILFNLEQADGNSPWMLGSYPRLLRAFAVLDYSVRNQTALKHFGIHHTRLLPIGYASGLARIQPAKRRDIDVLFYGSLNERRRLVLQALQDRGVKVVHLFDVYDEARDQAIARSKIVLNMHFYETAIFESVRVSFLLANGVCVVTEGYPDDPDLASLANGLAIAPYDQLVDRCVALLGDSAMRAALTKAGRIAIRAQSQTSHLKMLFDDLKHLQKQGLADNLLAVDNRY